MESLTLLCCNKMVHFPIFSFLNFQMVLIRFINNWVTLNWLPESCKTSFTTCSLKAIKLKLIQQIPPKIEESGFVYWGKGAAM